jgi:hypothetical protein
MALVGNGVARWFTPLLKNISYLKKRKGAKETFFKLFYSLTALLPGSRG